MGELAGKAWAGLDRSPALSVKPAVNWNACRRRKLRAEAQALSDRLRLYARCCNRVGLVSSSRLIRNWTFTPR